MNRPNEWIVQTDLDDNLVGEIERKEAHRTKKLVLHREVMTLLYTDTERKQFVLQHRSLTKEQLPGYWTLSATGHVEMSDVNKVDKEGYLTAAAREVNEEIGVIAVNLRLVGKIIQKNRMNWAIMGVVTGQYKGELKLDKEEVSEVKVFDKKSIIEVNDKLTPGARECLKYLNII